MIILFGFIFIITINFSFGIIPANLSVIKHKTLVPPEYVKDPFLFLMFNDLSDVKRLGTFSDYIDPQTNRKRYNGEVKLEVTKSTPFKNDKQLVLKSYNAHHAISFPFTRPIDPSSKCIVMQYDFRFPNDHKCGSAYVKLMPKSFEAKSFSNASNFVLLFGPDKCGSDYQIKFQFKYKDQLGHLVDRNPVDINDYRKFPHFLGDNVTHVVTLQICNNQTFRLYKNLKLISEGHLVNDFDPSPGGLKNLVDENDEQPDYWDSREHIADPDFQIPADYDPNEPEFIADKFAKMPYNWVEDEPIMIRSTEPKPDDWNEEEKGPYKPPMVRNPRCRNHGCGKWKPPIIRNPKFQPLPKAPIIPNPNYMGNWKPRLVPNPDFNENENVYHSLLEMNTLGLEVWAQTGGVYVDNFIITDDIKVAQKLAIETWWPKYLVDANDPSYYREVLLEIFDPTYTKKKRKRSLYYYIHWIWASLPLMFGIPLLLYIVTLIRRQSASKLDIDEVKSRWLMSTYDKLCSEYQGQGDQDGDSSQGLVNKPLGTSKLNEISEESITQLFGGENDPVADALRQRFRMRKNDKSKDAMAKYSNFF